MEGAMDYSYFTSGPQPYLYGIQPLGVQDQTHHHQTFDSSSMDYGQKFSHLDPNLQCNQEAFISQISPPNRSFSNSAAGGGEPNGHSRNPSGSDPLGTPIDEQPQMRSSDEEKDSQTPAAQSRRKEQNRAAQRAFRERKERHVKELETKLAALEQNSASLQNDNERLKRELAKIATENEILRATSSPEHPLNANPHTISSNYAEEELDRTGPMYFVPTDSHNLQANLEATGNRRAGGYGQDQPGKVSAPHRIVLSPTTGEKLLGAGATWDMIQEHELFQQGMVDIGDVCERLKALTKCDGTGPTFEEGDVRRIIEESVKAGRDELI